MDSPAVGILNVQVKSNFKDFIKETEQAKRNLAEIKGISFGNIFDKTGIKDFNRELSQVEEKSKRTINHFKGLSGGSSFAAINKLGKTLTRRVTAPMIAAGTIVGRQEASIEHELNNIGTIIEGDYKQKKEDIKKWSREISDETGISWKEILKSTYQGIQSSVKDKDLEEMTRVAAKLSKVGGDETTTSNAMDLLTTYMNAYGLSMEETTKLSGQFFKAQLRGKVTIGEMADSMGRVALLANKLKVDIPDTLGIVSALTAQGLEIRQVSTGINAIFNSIIKPSDEALETVEKLNNYLESMGKKKIDFSVKGFKKEGMKNWLKQVIESTGGNEELLGKLFPNIRATGIVAALSSNNTWNNFDKFSKEIGSADFGTVEEASKHLEGTFYDLKKAWNEFKNTLVEKGVVEAVLKNLIGFFKKLTTIIDNIPTDKIGEISKFAMIAVALGPVLRIVGGLGVGFFKLGGHIKTVMDLIGGTSGLMSVLGSTGFLAVTGIIAVVVGFLGYLNDMDNKVEDITGKFEYMELTGKSGIGAWWDRIKTQIGGLIDGLHAAAQEVGGEVTKATGKAVKGLSKVNLASEETADKIIDKGEERLERSRRTQRIADYKRERPYDYMVSEEVKNGALAGNGLSANNRKFSRDGILTDDSLRQVKKEINEKINEEPFNIDEFKINTEDIKKEMEDLHNEFSFDDDSKGNEILEALKNQGKEEEKRLKKEQEIIDKKQEEERIVKSIADTYKRNTEELRSQLTIGEKMNRNRISVARLLRNERKKAEMLQNLDKMQEELSGKITDKGILKDLNALGLEGYGKIEALSRMTKAQLDQFIESRTIIGNTADKMALNNTKFEITVNADSEARATDIAETLKKEFERRGISIA